MPYHGSYDLLGSSDYSPCSQQHGSAGEAECVPLKHASSSLKNPGLLNAIWGKQLPLTFGNFLGFFLQKDPGTQFSGDVHHHLWYLLVLPYCCWVPHSCGVWFFKSIIDKSSSVNTCCFAMKHGRWDHGLWLLMLQLGKPGAVKPENWAPETAGVICERSVESAGGLMSSLVRC